MKAGFRESLFHISNPAGFERIALDIFRFQVLNNPVYGKYVSFLGIAPDSVSSVEMIPFLPIEFFRNHRVITGGTDAEKVFESSGTTGSETSRHFVTDLKVYEESFLSSFRLFYGDPHDYFFAALLPSYVERGNSSLVYMADFLIRNSSDRRSSFFPDDHEKLIYALNRVRSEKRKGMLIGVSFALLDLAEKLSPDLSGITVVETGGMKGKRRELTRAELHGVLKEKLNLPAVHSEYGMTELLSQAWSKGEGIFHAPPWMRILLREINDPFSVIGKPGITGGINIIDLANFNSCSFISTGDLGRLHPGGGFEVLGRFGNSDIRGCNLLIE
jgi:phenylacetate-coenzyme A ligase PaaK-like adenylate-forming protein